jgi:exopolyphosphatase/pppGpp-phosphohydrolase
MEEARLIYLGVAHLSSSVEESTSRVCSSAVFG